MFLLQRFAFDLELEGGMSGNPTLVSLVTWAVSRGFRHFRRLHVTMDGLYAQSKISQYDFVALMPAKSSISLHTVQAESGYPLTVSSSNFGDEVEWWSDMNWGMFTLAAYLAKEKLIGDSGVSAYLQIQCPTDSTTTVAQHCASVQRKDIYRTAVKPVLKGFPNIEAGAFDRAFLQSYCLLKTQGVPFWSQHGTGHPFFRECFPGTANGDVVTLLPVLDLASHSSTPNATFGVPDDDMVQWLAGEHGVESSQLFVLQALRDIEPSELITVDKNANYGFDPDTFRAWFGFPFS